MTAFAIWAVGFLIATDFNAYVRHVTGKPPHTSDVEAFIGGIWFLVGAVLFIIGLFKN